MSIETGSQRRGELAAFLRSRRERVRPEDVGLPPGPRRRTAGLRREEVAQLAGVGVTWYTWLEQGRPINASIQVLDAVARTLKLDPAEREHLFRLADVPVTTALPEGTCQLLGPEVQEILDGLGPLPASVLTERYDLLAWNAAYAILFPRSTSLPPSERNTLLQSFIAPACCRPFANYEEQLAAMVAQLRGAYGRHVGDTAWTAFIRRLEAASPEFARMWATQDVAAPASYLKILRHPAYDHLAMKTTSLAVLAAPGTRLVIYTPADEPTRAAMELLLKGDGADTRFPCWPYHQAERERLLAPA
jgi:transcriptional regulator with XRE-family HTH domain